MAKRVLQLSIISSSRLRLGLETQSRVGQISFSALGAKYNGPIYGTLYNANKENTTRWITLSFTNVYVLLLSALW
jgi:hypothetical protein